MKLVASIPFTGSGDLELFTRSLMAYMERDGTMVVLGENEQPATRHFVIATSSPNPRIIDVTDPERPYVVATVPCGGWDVDVRKDGMLAVLSSGSCYPATGNAVVDLANVYEPKVLRGAPGSAHTLRLHPDGRYLYLSGGDIYDLVDPSTPVSVGSFAQPHAGLLHTDLSFSPDGDRMYSATQPVYVYDTSDPANPRVITRILVPGMVIVHDTLPTPDGRFLFISEETVGGVCPHGAVSVWDMLVEASPVYVGQVWAGAGPVTDRENDEPAVGNAGLGFCSSHVMTMDPGGRSFSIGWYAGGTRVFDFGGLYTAPAAAGWGKYGVGVVEKGFVKPSGADTSAAKQYAALPGYVFSADYALGFYVSKFVTP